MLLRLGEMHVQARSLADKSFLLDVESKKRQLFCIVDSCTQLIDTPSGHKVMTDPRAAIAAIAEDNRMNGEYAKDNEQQRDTVFLNINLAGHAP